MILFWLGAVVEAVAWFGFSELGEEAVRLGSVEGSAPFLEPALALSAELNVAWEVPEEADVCALSGPAKMTFVLDRLAVVLARSVVGRVGDAVRGLAVSAASLSESLYAIEEAPSWLTDDEYLPGLQMASPHSENRGSSSVTPRLVRWE